MSCSVFPAVLASCPMCPIACFLSRVLSSVPAACVLSRVSCSECVLSDVSCCVYPVACALLSVSCSLCPVACILLPVSCLVCPVACVLQPVSSRVCLQLVSCRLYPVACVLSRSPSLFDLPQYMQRSSSSALKAAQQRFTREATVTAQAVLILLVPVLPSPGDGVLSFFVIPCMMQV